MFVDLTELIARVDGIPITDEGPEEDLPAPGHAEQSAAAWQWWIDQEQEHRR